MAKAAINLEEEINGRVITEIKIIRGPNKWETIIQGMIVFGIKDFTFQLREGHAFSIQCKICGVINSPDDVQKDQVEEDWGLLLLLNDKTLFKELGIEVPVQAGAQVLFRGRYNTQVRAGRGELILFNNPSGSLPVQSRFALKF
ncbi:hypothetical protein ACFL2U_02120 [Patescibacteria group bacterium]